jgi:hypothetical protein
MVDYQQWVNMLSDALKTLSASPSAGEKKKVLAAMNGQIAVLESQLGLEHKLMPILNVDRAGKRLAELQSALAGKGVRPTSAAAAPAARLFESSGDPLTDKAIMAAGCHNLAQYRAKLKADRAFATATALPQGSISRAAAEKNLGLALAELRNS